MAKPVRRTFTEAQKRAILQEGATGNSLAAVLQKHKLGESTYYNWKKKYGAAAGAKREVHAGKTPSRKRKAPSVQKSSAGQARGTRAQTAEVLENLRALRATLVSDLKRVTQAIEALEA